jgi:hypothetical protein
MHVGLFYIFVIPCTHVGRFRCTLGNCGFVSAKMLAYWASVRAFLRDAHPIARGAMPMYVWKACKHDLDRAVKYLHGVHDHVMKTRAPTYPMQNTQHRMGALLLSQVCAGWHYCGKSLQDGILSGALGSFRAQLEWH